VGRDTPRASPPAASSWGVDLAKRGATLVVVIEGVGRGCGICTPGRGAGRRWLGAEQVGQNHER
jgi:hypothetical protein